MVSWQPQRVPSLGATAYHDATGQAKWCLATTDSLVELGIPYIHEGDTVVDFGAGTGITAQRILDSVSVPFSLVLVDNSESWLGKAHEVLSPYANVSFALLRKTGKGFQSLDEVMGRDAVQHIFSANTVHLIEDIQAVFSGMYACLTPQGRFIFQSGNIFRHDRPDGLLMIDDTIHEIHTSALDILRQTDEFIQYREGLDERIAKEASQRVCIFPRVRNIKVYKDALEKCGFHSIDVRFETVRVSYKEWLNFCTIKRIQAGILPEIGGRDATPQQERDRDTVIRLACKKYFESLAKNNSHADTESFAAEWVYVRAIK
jgi:SAM-dependent methyltransferase